MLLRSRNHDTLGTHQNRLSWRDWGRPPYHDLYSARMVRGAPLPSRSQSRHRRGTTGSLQPRSDGRPCAFRLRCSARRAPSASRPITYPERCSRDTNHARSDLLDLDRLLLVPCIVCTRQWPLQGPPAD